MNNEVHQSDLETHLRSKLREGSILSTESSTTQKKNIMIEAKNALLMAAAPTPLTSQADQIMTSKDVKFGQDITEGTGFNGTVPSSIRQTPSTIGIT